MKALEFITENWEYISAAAAGIIGLIVRLVPTNKNIDMVSRALKFLDKIIPNVKKGGGTHVILALVLSLSMTVSIAQEYDTLFQDRYIDSENVGQFGMAFGNVTPLSFFGVSISNNTGTRYGNFSFTQYGHDFSISNNNTSSGISMFGNSMNFYSYQNTVLSQGVVFNLGLSTYFTDYRSSKNGIVYSVPKIYVTQPGSLTDKSYVDDNQLLLFQKESLPSPIPSGRLIFVTNATGGAVPAYSDNSNWRRVTDGTIIN